MRRALLFVLAVLFATSGLQAQEPTAAPDGGTMQQIQSILVLPVANAPFSAVVRTEWTKMMPDGSKSTVYNHRTVVRDNAGRVFQERRYFAPDGNTKETPITLLQYDDPNLQERYICYPQRRTCEREMLRMPTTLPALLPAGPLRNGMGTVARLDLGHKSMESLDAIGSRETVTYRAGAFGNEKPQEVVRELWFSPRLQLNLVTYRFDPRASALQKIEVTGVSLSEPDPKLFALPEGYRVVTGDVGGVMIGMH